MDLTLIIFLAIVFVAIFSTSYIAPILLAKLWAKRFGWNISWHDAKFLKNHYCLKRDFLEAAKEIQEIEDIPTEKLCLHYMASGDIKDLKNGIEKLRKMNIAYEVDTLLVVLLAKKNIDTVIAKIGSERKLELVKSLTEE